MQCDSTCPDGIGDLARKAAVHERNPDMWERRFRSLLEAGVLTLPAPLGSELALHLRVEDGYLDPARSAKLFLRYLLPVLRTGLSAGIDLSNAASDGFSDWLAEFSSVTGAGLACIKLAAGRLLFSISMDHPGVREFLQLRGRQDLGYPLVAVRFGSDSSCYRSETWNSLTALSHMDERIKLVPAMAARPLSGLHAMEYGQCVMPRGLFEARANTAWMVLEIDATRLTSPAFLRSQLTLCLRFIDNLIDSQEWPTPALRVDALLNRRIALHIVRLGQMVANAGLDPKSFVTLRLLQRWLWFIRRSFIRESNRLAKNRGPFPAFGAADLVASLTPCFGVTEARRQIRNRSMRNRHMFALSPFTVFPDETGGENDESWLHLLPALGCADTLSMYGNDTRKRLRLNAWARMLQMTGAMATGGDDYAQCYLS